MVAESDEASMGREEFEHIDNANAWTIEHARSTWFPKEERQTERLYMCRRTDTR